MLCFSHWLLNLEWNWIGIVSDLCPSYVITDKHTNHSKYRTRTSNKTLSPPCTVNCECMALTTIGQADTTVNTPTEPTKWLSYVLTQEKVSRQKSSSLTWVGNLAIHSLGLIGNVFIACGSRYKPFVVTSCAYRMHRASGPGRGKPVLISILARSLAFHALTLERSLLGKSPFSK